MTDLVIGVRIKADGSGLVGQARASSEAVDQLGGSLGAAGAQGKAMATGSAAAEQAADALAQASRATRAAVDGLADGQAQANAALRSGAVAANDHAKATNASRGSSMELEHVVRALSDSVAAGIDPFQAVRMEMGRILEATSMMGGGMKGFASFMMSGWGLALQVGAAVAVPLIEELLKTDTAMEDVKLGANALGQAQGVLGEMFDLTTGKLKTNTAALMLNAQAQAINLRAQAAKKASSARDAFENAGDPGTVAKALGIGGLTLAGITGATNDSALVGWSTGKLAGNNDVRSLAQRAREAVNLPSRTNDEQLAQAKAFRDLERQAELTDFSGSGVDKHDFIQGVGDYVSARSDRAIADLIDKSLDSGQLADGLRKDAKAKKPRKPKSTAGLTDFGIQAGNEIQNLEAPFQDTPTQAVKANRAIGELDALIVKLGQRKPPNFETLIDQARTAEQVIRDGINKPLDDFLKNQLQTFQVGQLVLAGRQDEADAQREIFQLERQIGPLTDEQKAAVLGTVEGLSAQARQIDIVRAKQQIYLDALGQMKGIVQDATQAFERGDLGAIIKSPGKLLDAFETLKGKQLFDTLFDGAFRDLQDQVTGTNVVQAAADNMVNAVGVMTGQTSQAGASIDYLGKVAARSAQQIEAAHAAPAGAADGSGAQAADTTPAASAATTGPDIVVRGGNTPEALFARASTKIATSLAGLFTNDTTAASIGKAIGKYAGDAFSGAATGTLVAGVGKAIGVNLSPTGSQLGGALGGVLTGIKGVTSALGPLGSLLTPALSIVGGLIGSLFSKPKYATADLTSNASTAPVSGNSAGAEKVATGLGSSIQDGLASIGKQLGAAIGDYSVAIGTFNGKYRVNTYGTSASLNYNNFSSATLYNFDDDQAAAVAFAISTAVKQGAVQGLSAAVTKALESSSDINKALQEALNVRSLQYALGGALGAVQQIFDTEAATAKERLRLAQTYGLDIVATEKLNADSLTKLMASTLKTAVGSLQSVLDDMATGDLFEGSASDRRTALLTQIADAKTRADAGEDGAADELATLYRNLLSTSKDAYGTAGTEYAADRATVGSGAAEVVKAEQDRINQAAGVQQKIADAATTNNTLTDEGNDLLSSINSKLSTLVDATAATGSGSGVGPNYQLTQYGQLA